MQPSNPLARRHRELEAMFDQLAREHDRIRVEGSSAERAAHIQALRRTLHALREHREALRARADEIDRRASGHDRPGEPSATATKAALPAER